MSEYYSFDGWILKDGKPLMMEKVLEIMNNEEKLKDRVKHLEQKINEWAREIPILKCKKVIVEMLKESSCKQETPHE